MKNPFKRKPITYTFTKNLVLGIYGPAYPQKYYISLCIYDTEACLFPPGVHNVSKFTIELYPKWLLGRFEYSSNSVLWDKMDDLYYQPSHTLDFFLRANRIHRFDIKIKEVEC